MGVFGFVSGVLLCYLLLVPGGTDASNHYHWAECKGKTTVFRTVNDEIPGSRVLEGRPCKLVHD